MLRIQVLEKTLKNYKIKGKSICVTKSRQIVQQKLLEFSSSLSPHSNLLRSTPDTGAAALLYIYNSYICFLKDERGRKESSQFIFKERAAVSRESVRCTMYIKMGKIEKDFFLLFFFLPTTFFPPLLIYSLNRSERSAVFLLLSRFPYLLCRE